VNDLDRTFGSAAVSPEARRQLITDVFRRVAPRYDLMNDLMSMGLHRLWKRRLRRATSPGRGERILDLAGGTGDVARLLTARGAVTVVCDPSVEMMHEGVARDLAGIHWLAGRAEALPVGDDALDAVTIAFGIRNVTRLSEALREIRRVLKPGGRFVCLEFSRPWAPIRPAYDLFSRTVIPRLGAWVAREPSAYSYLIESIRRFPAQEEMKDLIAQAGFERVRYQNLSMGIVCIHTGVKPPHETD